jgi:membrane protein
MVCMAARRDDLSERLQRWAEGRRGRVAGHNPWAVAVGTLRSAAEDRVTGLAAEMAFFALLSLVPLIVAVGAALGFLERFLGPDEVARGQQVVVGAARTVFSTQASEDVIVPLVDGLLAEQRAGVALSSVVAAVYLASRVFTAMIRALDTAYAVQERRGAVVLRLLAVAFALGFVVVVTLVLLLVVAGPLLGGGHALAGRLGLGDQFAMAWSLARWPLVVVVAVAFFATLYHLGPNAPTRWRTSLPGAVLGVALWISASLGLRLYLATLGAPGAQFQPTDDALAVTTAAIGAVAAVVLWVYLSGICLLLGGELNSQLDADRGPPGAAPRWTPRATL